MLHSPQSERRAAFVGEVVTLARDVLAPIARSGERAIRVPRPRRRSLVGQSQRGSCAELREHDDLSRVHREVLDGVQHCPEHGDLSLRRLAAFGHGWAPGDADGADLGAAADIVDKVARHAYRLTDEDFASARRAGLGDDELFELVVATAVGAGMARRAIGRSAVERWEAGA